VDLFIGIRFAIAVLIAPAVRNIFWKGSIFMSKILVFGHQNPDTDAVISAISFAYLARKKFNLNACAVTLGEVNEETQYALDYFGLKAPRIVNSAKEEGVDTVILVDHNEFQQSIADIEDVNIWGVVDHHRIANFKTAVPLFYRAEPVGSTASIVARMMQENKLEIPKDIAGGLLSAIVSDTLLLKSPTTNPTDRPIAEYLANIAGVNLAEYGLNLLKSGTNVASKSEEDLVNLDAKTFVLGETNVRVAQINTVDIKDVLKRQGDLEKVMQAENKKNGYDDFVLMITDILENNSEIVVVGKNIEKIEAAFNVKLTNNRAFIKGAVSRKKQIIPPLTKIFAK